MDTDKNGWLYCYPFFILMYGLGTFVSGRLLQFKPLMIGGILNWILACVAVFFSFDYQMLFAAAAILSSYLIPGYLIKPQKNA
jgi:predicted PurR-regulated permease PerM